MSGPSSSSDGSDSFDWSGLFQTVVKTAGNVITGNRSASTTTTSSTTSQTLVQRLGLDKIFSGVAVNPDVNVIIPSWVYPVAAAAVGLIILLIWRKK
jgi:hypothetical protein